MGSAGSRPWQWRRGAQGPEGSEAMSPPPRQLGALTHALFRAARHFPCSLCTEVNELFSFHVLQGPSLPPSLSSTPSVPD